MTDYGPDSSVFTLFRFTITDLLAAVFTCGLSFAAFYARMSQNEVDPSAGQIVALMSVTILVAVVALFFCDPKMPRKSRVTLFSGVFGISLLAGMAIHGGTGAMAQREFDAVAKCRVISDAQQEYFKKYGEYAVNISQLYESRPGAADVRLISKDIADSENGKHYRGYRYKILTGQIGNRVPGGPHSYTDPSGRMTKGFGVLSWPAKWDVTARNTFMIDWSGFITQLDQGPETESLSRARLNVEYDIRNFPGPGDIDP